MFDRKDKVVIGVSGGSDSIALLHILNNIEELELQIIVAHVNHKLRDEESDNDAKFVREITEDLNFDYEYKEVDTLGYKEKNKLSLEDAARKLRYEFFDQVLDKHSANRIATAHTLDDQAETVLIRLLRGSGSLGLSAIRPVNNNLVRPLLNIRKAELREYLENQNISWREDSSNQSNKFIRNRIRNELLPLMEDIKLGAKDVIARSAEIASIDSAYVTLQIEKIYDSVISESSFGLKGSVPNYIKLPIAIRLGLLRKVIEKFKGDLSSIYSNHFFSIDNLIMSHEPSGQIDLPNNLVISKGYELFCISDSNELEKEYKLNINELGNWKLSDDLEIEIEFSNDTSLWGNESVAYLSMKRVGFPIKIRSYKDGDRFMPLGMNNLKKVKDFFIDEKIPKFLRKKVPVFQSGNNIIWLGGLRIDERFKADPEDDEFLRIKISGAIDEIVVFDYERKDKLN